MSIQFSIVISQDPLTGQAYLDFFASSESVTAIGGYTIAFSLYLLEAGIRTALVPTAVENIGDWDILDPNLETGSVAGISAEGVLLDPELNRVLLFRVILPAGTDPTDALLVSLSPTESGVWFDATGAELPVTSSNLIYDPASGDASFVEVSGPFLEAPAAATYTDTPGDDIFLATSGTLRSFDADNSPLTYGILGATPVDGFASQTGIYGTLTVNTTTGAYTYTPLDAAIEALKSGDSESFTVTVSDLANTASESFQVNLAGANDLPTGTVTISGSAIQGETLVAANTLADAEGLGSITYQWKANGVAISGATLSSYTLTQVEVGKSITVAASYTDSRGTAESVTSDATTAVANVDDEATGTLAVSGTAAEGGMLVASLDNVADADGATSIAWQWQISSDGGTEWTDLAGAQAASYAIASDQSQVGKALRVVATTTDVLGSSTTFTSWASAPIANVDDEASGTLDVSGTAQEGGSLSASLVGVVDPDGATTTAWQWQISINGSTGWSDLADARSASYAIASDQSQVGKYLRVVATTTDSLGGTSTFTSNASAPVANINDAPTGKEVKCAVAHKALDNFKARIRQLTRRSGGRSMARVVEKLRSYLLGWKAYFGLAQTPRAWQELDEWLRHRLRAIQLRQWKRPKMIYRDLKALGASEDVAKQVAGNCQHWCRNSDGAIKGVLTIAYFYGLGVPRPS